MLASRFLFSRPPSVGAAASLAVCLTAWTAAASPAADTPDSDDVQTVTVTARRESRLGSDISASAGTITRDQILEQPTLRPAEVMQLVPGLVVVQHAAGGKANQYYLRGFEMDHGDMFSTWVDGVPVNEVSHVHGPGYTDLNWLIPELIDHIDFEKGPYDAARGDFANAGSADLRLVSSLPRSLAKEEIGTDGWARLFSATSVDVGPGTVLAGVEYSHYDGPWEVADNYRKRNGVLKYTQGDAADGFSLAAQGYRGNWLGNDQVPLAAIEDGTVSRYGSLDPTTGGASGRYSLYGDWHESDDAGATHVTAYLVRYTLNLYSNFTDALAFPDTGDGLQQNERRWTYGGHAERDLGGDYLGRAVEDRFGVEVRSDDIHSLLNDVERRRVWAHVRSDHVSETMVSPWYQNSVTWTDWLTTYAGVRADILTYRDDSDPAANSGDGLAWRPSPKAGVKLGPWADTDFFFQLGLGISSQSIEGVTSTLQPGPYSASQDSGGGQPAQRQEALSRNRGMEVGMHSRLIPGLDTTLSLWVLESENEFVYDGDTGAVDGSGRPGRRWGVEWNNRWQPADWIDVTADIAVSRARYTDQNNPAGAQIPESVRTMTAGQVSLHDLDWAPGATWTVGWRYLGPRFLIEDASARSHASLVFNTALNYRVCDNLGIGLEVLNLLNAHYYDAQYWYQYRLPGQAAQGVTGDVVHPSEPRQIRFSLSEYF